MWKREANAREAGPATVSAAFNEAAWLRRLQELNPWAQVENGMAFEAARKAECVRRWEAGKEEWNRWAEVMGALRREAEVGGAWQIDTLGVEPRNDVSRQYLLLAEADFLGHQFAGNADFEGFVFPGNGMFIEAQFSSIALFGGAQFSGGHVWFEGAQFSGLTSFEGAQFSSNASFERAQFSDTAKFERAQFSGAAKFGAAQFSGDYVAFDEAQFSSIAWFGGAQFSGRVGFEGAQFGGLTSFEGAQFNSVAMFGRAQFSGGDVRFDGARFAKSTFFNDVRFAKRAGFDEVVLEGPAYFTGAVFDQKAIFTKVQSRRGFSLDRTDFARTPDFLDAVFHEPPRLDNATLPQSVRRRLRVEGEPRRWLFRGFAIAADADEQARLRKLRSMVSQAKDHENEIRFNGYEVAARRFWIDTPGWLPNRFWLGWWFEKLSNYGQSVLRPLSVWLVVLLLFAGLYFATSRNWQVDKMIAWPLNAACHASYAEAGKKRQPTNALVESLVLSFRNALIFDRSDVSRRMYGCLYGFDSEGDQDYPVIPPTITILSTLQSFLSVVFIFLFGLGLRNMFRIK